MKGRFQTRLELIQNLRKEFMTIRSKIAAAEFAVAVLPLNSQEKKFLEQQITAMIAYANGVKKRAWYAANKHRKRHVVINQGSSKETVKKDDKNELDDIDVEFENEFEEQVDNSEDIIEEDFEAALEEAFEEDVSFEED